MVAILAKEKWVKGVIWKTKNGDTTFPVNSIIKIKWKSTKVAHQISLYICRIVKIVQMLFLKEYYVEN